MKRTHRLEAISHSASGRPRTYRLVKRSQSSRLAAAYRRLAVTILGLDVPTVAAELSSRRRAAAA
jgi:hypothetical protein